MKKPGQPEIQRELLERVPSMFNATSGFKSLSISTAFSYAQLEHLNQCYPNVFRMERKPPTSPGKNGTFHSLMMHQTWRTWQTVFPTVGNLPLSMSMKHV
jgi:hypothetical protein